MCEIPFVRVQLYILGKCTFGDVLCGDEMCKLSVTEHRASAAVQTSHPRVCFFYNNDA